MASKYENISRKTKIGAGVGAGLIGGMLLAGLVPSCSAIHSKKTVTVPHAEVFKIEPVTIDMRAVEGAKILAKASVTFGTPVDHTWGIGSLTSAVESTVRDTSIFEGSTDKYGEVITLVGARTAGIQVQPLLDGGQQITIPTSDIVEFSAIDESSSIVTHNDGDLSALGQFEWSVLGGIFPGQSSQVARGRAALDAVARAEAINVAQTTCANNAWPQAQAAIQDAYRLIGQQQHDQQVAEGLHVSGYNPALTVVSFTGPTPRWQAPYSLPSHTSVSSGDKKSPVSCSVDASALTTPGSYGDAFGNGVSTSLNALSLTSS